MAKMIDVAQLTAERDIARQRARLLDRALQEARQQNKELEAQVANLRGQLAHREAHEPELLKQLAELEGELKQFKRQDEPIGEGRFSRLEPD